VANGNQNLPAVSLPSLLIFDTFLPNDAPAEIRGENSTPAEVERPSTKLRVEHMAYQTSFRMIDHENARNSAEEAVGLPDLPSRSRVEVWFHFARNLKIVF